MFAAPLPPQLSPANVIGEDVNDVGFFAEAFLQRRQLLIYGFIFGGPGVGLLFLLLLEVAVKYRAGVGHPRG